MAKLRITGKASSQPNDVEIASVDPFTNPETVTINKELDGTSSVLFRATLTPQGGGGGQPPVNQPPTIDVPTSVKGKVNVEMDLIARVDDIDGTVDDVNWKQKTGTAISFIQIDDGGLYTARLTPTQVGVYDFEVEAFDNQNARTAKQVKVTVEQDTTTPPPQPGNVIFSSIRDTKLHDGNVRTITKEGDIAPGKLGVECRASGSPKIKVNADGTFSLVSGSGGVDNFSTKLRSRHQEGQDCSNRFGGFGCAIDGSKLQMKTESCHNNHENSLNKSHGVNVNDGQFHTLEFECKDSPDGKSVLFKAWVDGTQKQTGAHNSPKAFYLDKASFEQNSYIWLRLNNADHGRIYIMAKNYNSKLKAVFKLEPSKNAITFKEVTLTTVN